MPLDRYERSRAEHPFVGKWHLTGMELWEGFDELDEVSGSGWMRLTSANLAVGLIKVPRWRPMDVHGTSSPAPQDRVRHGITRPLTSEKWP